MTKHYKAITIAIFGTLALFGVALFLSTLLSSNNAIASAPSGLPATVATSSALSITTASLSIFATSTCSARVITTGSSAILITFTDVQGAVPTATLGHWQAASTTIAYDSGLYGCGTLRAFSQSAQTIYVSESR